MLTVKNIDVRDNFNSLCEKVFCGETLLILRPKDEQDKRKDTRKALLYELRLAFASEEKEEYSREEILEKLEAIASIED